MVLKKFIIFLIIFFDSNFVISIIINLKFMFLFLFLNWVIWFFVVSKVLIVICLGLLFFVFVIIIFF